MNIKSVATLMSAAALIAFSSVSCQYDDTALWNEVNSIKQELADLRLQLETELNAIKDLVNGQVTVKEVKQQGAGIALYAANVVYKHSVLKEGLGDKLGP